MPRDRKGSDFTLPLRFIPLFVSLSLAPSLPSSCFRARANCRERVTRMLAPVGNFSALSLTHRNPSTAIHLPPCLTGLLSKYRPAAPDDASTLDRSLPFIFHANNIPAIRVHLRSELLFPVTSAVDKTYGTKYSYIILLRCHRIVAVRE